MFTHPSICKRLAIGFGSTLVLMVALAALNLVELLKVRDAATKQSVAQAQEAALANEWLRAIQINSQRAAAIGRSSDPTIKQFFEADIKKGSARSSELQKHFNEPRPASKARPCWSAWPRCARATFPLASR